MGWIMALNIKNRAVEQLVEDVASLTGESKTEAVRRALEERKARLKQGIRLSKRERWQAFLEQDVWPTIDAQQLGRSLSREEEDAILGYSPLQR